MDAPWTSQEPTPQLYAINIIPKALALADLAMALLLPPASADITKVSGASGLWHAPVEPLPRLDAMVGIAAQLFWPMCAALAALVHTLRVWNIRPALEDMTIFNTLILAATRLLNLAIAALLINLRAILGKSGTLTAEDVAHLYAVVAFATHLLGVLGAAPLIFEQAAAFRMLSSSSANLKGAQGTVVRSFVQVTTVIVISKHFLRQCCSSFGMCQTCHQSGCQHDNEDHVCASKQIAGDSPAT